MMESMNTRTVDSALESSEGNLANIAALVMVGILSIVILNDWQSWQESGPQLGLMLLFAMVMLRMQGMHSPRQAHLYISLQTLIVSLALLQGTVFLLLFFILIAQAMVGLPTRAGLRWISLFAVITVIGNFVNDFDLVPDLINSVVNCAGFLFFGAFGNSLMRAETARAESQKLLAELQAAHSQLQSYAERVETLAVAEERNRLSREMHDTLGHRLTVSIVQLEGAGRLLERDPDRAGQMIQTVRNELKDGLAELRDTLAALRSPIVTGETLPQALFKLTADFENATHLVIHTDFPKEWPTLTEAQALTIYRMAQEALTNVQRHATASAVRMTVAFARGQASVHIEDDGIGFDPKRITPGIGLRGMRERAAQLHGQVEITSQPQQGVRLKLTLPLQEEKSNA